MAEPNLPLKNIFFECNNLKKMREKKKQAQNKAQKTSSKQDKDHNTKIPASTQGGERQAAATRILRDSIAFGIQALVWSASWESLSKMRKEFPI